MTENYCERNVSDMQSQPDVGLFSPKTLGCISRPRDHKKQRGWRWFDLLMERTDHMQQTVIPCRSAFIFRHQLTIKTKSSHIP